MPRRGCARGRAAPLPRPIDLVDEPNVGPACDELDGAERDGEGDDGAAQHDARRDIAAARQRLEPARRALDWLSAVAREMRAERLTPLAAHAEKVWAQLRQERHIDLTALRLVGRGAQRRVAVDVSVEGIDGPDSAPGLLSQGEFQALALPVE